MTSNRASCAAVEHAEEAKPHKKFKEEEIAQHLAALEQEHLQAARSFRPRLRRRFMAIR
ncbi:MAG: hypothetical protein U1G07_23720 [Verrucomicrobiota bacterium]